MIIRRTFEEQLGELQNDLLRLGRFVEEALGKSIDALVRQDLPLAKQVIADDDFADDMTLGIQTRTMQLLALQQPMARDLRFVGASMRITVDLERIGDHAASISKVTRRLAGQSYFKPLVDVPRLGEMSRKMVSDSLTAFISHDTNLAYQVAGADDAVDDLCDHLQRELMDKMRADATLVEQATQLLLVARALERVADHATNIAENIYYVETGDMRPLAREAHAENEAGRREALRIETANTVADGFSARALEETQIEGSTRRSALHPDLPVTFVESAEELDGLPDNPNTNGNGNGS
jgi:phosphate transport system protein